MLELEKIAAVVSGVAIRETPTGRARFVRLSDLSDLKAGRTATLATGDPPEVARALSIEQGDLIVAARGLATDVCLATDVLIGAFVSLDLYLVRPDSTRVIPEYLNAFLNLPATQAQFKTDKQGSSLARLPKDALQTTTIPLPPMRVQHMIAELACSFEEEGKLLRRLSDLNSILAHEAVARAICAAEPAHSTRSKD